MNTPTHIVLSIATLTRENESAEESDRPTYLLPATIGAILPDAAMDLFYIVEKFVLGMSEKENCNARYFNAGRQNVFDPLNRVSIASGGDVDPS